MAQKVQPQGLKSDGTLGTFRISDNNNLLVDFTPTSDDGLATAANQTSGEQKTQIVQSDGETVVDSFGGGVNHNEVIIVDEAAIEAGFTVEDIDFSGYKNFIITYVLGAGSGGTPNLTLSVKGKDSKGNSIPDADFVSSALSASSSGVALKGYDQSYNTIDVVGVLGGSGTIGVSTIIIEMKT